MPTQQAAQNPAQDPAGQPCTVLLPVSESAKNEQKRRVAVQCEGVMGDAGLEPTTSSV